MFSPVSVRNTAPSSLKAALERDQLGGHDTERARDHRADARGAAREAVELPTDALRCPG